MINQEKKKVIFEILISDNRIICSLSYKDSVFLFNSAFSKFFIPIDSPETKAQVEISLHKYSSMEEMVYWGYGFLKTRQNYRGYEKRTGDQWLYLLDREKGKLDFFCLQKNCYETVFKALNALCEAKIPITRGFFYHASAIELENYLFIFGGPSNSGKTTISQIAGKKRYAVYSDESVFIKKKKNQYIACSTPFGTICDVNKEKIISGFLFLKKNSNNSFAKISSSQATYRAWSDSFYRTQVICSEERKILFNQWFDMFASLPCYEMKFTRDFDQWEKLIALYKKQ